jgi:hypothetical protein
MGEELAAERLKTALAEQARLAAALEDAAGTNGEPASRIRLQASNLQVAICSRMVDGIERSHQRTAKLG